MINDIGYAISGDLTHAGVGLDSGSASGDAVFETGHSISGTFGYVVNDLVRTEFEFGYSEMAWDKLTVDASVTFSSGGSTLSVTSEAKVDGEIEAYYGTANLLFTPLAWKTFIPLIGGGIGFIDWEDQINSIDVSGNSLNVNADENATDFLATAIAGLEFNLGKNFVASARYRYFWADTGDDVVEDADGYNIMGNLAYRF